ncbi:MAG: hypothetical protein P1U38_03650 [Aeromicrobium sp.]|uniref:hypothetical protein n=1 Tax=Aeromicrobium sp. TaxID=1871063 RepID=UPI00262E2DB3|nr:hypothetical protein [Aeromicrobium sp.]MDF1703844.1 hypothetical protein [Aeromicrobium sp.]
MSDIRVVESAEALLEIAELDDVVFNYVGMERRPHNEDGIDLDPNFSIRPGITDDQRGLLVQVSAEVTTPDAEMRIEVEVRYRLAERIELPGTEVWEVFLGTSTMLTAVPFLREGFASLASRFRVDVPQIALARPQRLVAVPADRKPDPEGS